MKANITLVTGLYDMGRDQLDPSFKRNFSFYEEKFTELLKATVDFPLIVFTESKIVPIVNSIRDKSQTQIIERSSSEFRNWFEFSDKVKILRERPEWYKQASWLEVSPQAKLDLYLPFVLAKMFMLSDASITNPFNTEYFLWLDAGLTSTVHSGYFSHDKILTKLETYLDPFLFLAFPYATGTEIHGFNRKILNTYCGVPNVEFVCRGGLFGGSKKSIQQFNSEYYSLLVSTLSHGFLGTEESLFTVLAYRNPLNINLFMLQEYGMIANFCEAVKTGVGSFVDIKDIHKGTLSSSSISRPIETKEELEIKEIKKKDVLAELAIYCLTYNLPEQLQHTLTTIQTAYPELCETPAWILLDNSTNTNAQEQNKEIAKKYSMRYESHGNLGICGGRQWVAEDFASNPEFKTMVFFEDDMTLCGKYSPPCKNGFNRFHPNLFKKAISILIKDKLDFLKLSFTEFFGSSEKAWAWCNIPSDLRPTLFPDQPERLDDSLMPYTQFKSIKNFDGIPYALGLVHYCNWPILLTQEGSRKIYLNPKFDYPHESTIMSHTYQQQVKGEIRSGVLLMSPVEHYRFHHYAAEERVECR